MKPWLDGALTLTRALASEIVAEAFPDLAGAALAELGAGWDNTAYLVDGRVVVRIAMRPLAASLLEIERSVLGALPELPLRIPRPAWFAPRTSTWPFPLAAYPVLHGRMIALVEDGPARAAVGGPLGAFLAALRAVPPPDGMPVDLLRRVDLHHRLPMVLDRIAWLGARDAAFPAEALAALARDLVGTPPWGGPLVSCHGDLYARHVLVDEVGRATGVIDWGDVHRGDPAVDLAVLWHVVPPEGRAAFRDAYGPIDADTLARARFRAVFHATAEWWYGVEEGYASWRDEAVRGARWVLHAG